MKTTKRRCTCYRS